MSLENYRNQIAVCVAGWHLDPELFYRLDKFCLADIYLISHCKKDQFPVQIIKLIKSNHILFERNIGYDWGCYQQFLNTNKWNSYRYIFFMHDDITVSDVGFFEAAIALLDQGYPIIGNGRNSEKRDWPRTHLYCYAHSSWLPSSREFEHDTVRGSFFAIKTSTIKALVNFEVFWDPLGLNVGFGNYSLIATCGKIQDLFPGEDFGFLSTTYLESEFIREHIRAGYGRNRATRTQKYITKFYQQLAERSVVNRMTLEINNGEELKSSKLIEVCMKLISG